ncbi:Uncharacterised protein [Candidatus Anstonella stagnisolia]|nr:Uncharacterised protein [Candidatus Anstonella stagnisolia]
MKQKRKQKHSIKHSARKAKLIPPPPIPTHKKMGFNSMGLYGETGSAHFAALPESETEGSILLRQAEHRGSEYAKKKTMKNILFSLGCGIIAGFAAYYALSFALGLEGLVLYGASFVAFALAATVAFGTSSAY